MRFLVALPIRLTSYKYIIGIFEYSSSTDSNPSYVDHFSCYSTINDEIGPCDKIGLGGDEVSRQRGDVFRSADPACGVLFVVYFLEFGDSPGTPLFPAAHIDPSRADAVYAHIRPQTNCQGMSKRNNAAL